MTSEKIQAALAAIVESVKQMGAERFRAELDARGPGPLAHAFAEIEAFASEYMGGGVWIDQHGPTPLIAAMRCYVTSKLGDEVEIPKDLLNATRDFSSKDIT